MLREAFWSCALERGEEYDGESSIRGEAQSEKLHVLQIQAKDKAEHSPRILNIRHGACTKMAKNWTEGAI